MRIEKRYAVLSDLGVVLGLHKTKKQALCHLNCEPGSANSDVNMLVNPRYIICWPSKYDAVKRILDIHKDGEE